MLSPCKPHKSLHQQPSQKNKDTSEARPDITLKVLKLLNWRKILRRNNLLIWIHMWHITTHTKPVNTYDKNTNPVYMNWKMINIMPRLTGCTIHRIHQLHRIIGQQTSQQNCEYLQKNIWQRQRLSQERRVARSLTIWPKNLFLTKSHPVQDQEESATTSKVH